MNTKRGLKSRRHSAHHQQSSRDSITNYILYYFCIILVAIYVFILLTEVTNLSAEENATIDTNIEHASNNHPHHQHQPAQTSPYIGLTHVPVNAFPDDKNSEKQPCLHTYMQLTDGSLNYLYGILAIHGALIRTKSHYAHNVMLMPNVSRQQIELLHHLGIGTYRIDGSQMDPYLTECGNCWTVTFYKLFIFNLTQFDKILYLDADVGIMHHAGIDELFHHATPAAVSDRGGNHFELNGGVLLVAPDAKLFQTMMEYLPKVRNAKQLLDEAKARGENEGNLRWEDNWNSEWRDYCGDQGFLNAFFNSNETGYAPFYALHYRYGLLTSSFSNEWQRYLLQWRPYILKNVHFTVYKPWHQDGMNRFRQITDNIHRSAARGDKAGYQDEIMARFFVRYWLDIRIALDKCGEFCKRHFSDLQISEDVAKFLKSRPEPFTCYEEQIEFVSDQQFQQNYKDKPCPT